MQWKEDATAGSRMSAGRLAYGIRTTTVAVEESLEAHKIG